VSASLGVIVAIVLAALVASWAFPKARETGDA
jgi:hypothetical protein